MMVGSNTNIKNIEIAFLADSFLFLNRQFRYSEESFLTDIIGNDYLTEWLPQHPIFISTQTGSGKTTFIVKQIMTYYHTCNIDSHTKRNILYLCNRKLLDSQIKKELASYLDRYNSENSNYTQNIIEYHTEEGLAQEHCFGGDIYIYKYHDLMNPTTLNLLPPIDLVIFDEAHFFTADSRFNEDAFTLLHSLVNKFKHTKRVYISATIDDAMGDIMKEELVIQDRLMQNIQNRQNSQEMLVRKGLIYWSRVNQAYQNELTEGKEMSLEGIDNNNSDQKNMMAATKFSYVGINGYRYDNQDPFHNPNTIRPIIYGNVFDSSNFNTQILRLSKDKMVEELILFFKEQVKQNEKCLIFVNDYNVGEELTKRLNEITKDSAIFLNARNQGLEKNKAIVEQITRNQTYSQQYLVATSVLDNGVSLKDPSIKHLFLMSYDKTTFLQMLGRVRKIGNNKVQLYLPWVEDNCVLDALKKQQKALENKLEKALKNREEGESVGSVMSKMSVSAFVTDIMRLKQVVKLLGIKLNRESELGKDLLNILLSAIIISYENKKSKLLENYGTQFNQALYNNIAHELKSIKAENLINITSKNYLYMQYLLNVFVKYIFEGLTPSCYSPKNLYIKQFLQIVLALSNLIPERDELKIDFDIPFSENMDNLNGQLFAQMRQEDLSNYGGELGKKKLINEWKAREFILLNKIRCDLNCMCVGDKRLADIYRESAERLCKVFNHKILSDPKQAMINEYLVWMEYVPKEELLIHDMTIVDTKPVMTESNNIKEKLTNLFAELCEGQNKDNDDFNRIEYEREKVLKTILEVMEKPQNITPNTISCINNELKSMHIPYRIKPKQLSLRESDVKPYDDLAEKYDSYTPKEKKIKR